MNTFTSEKRKSEIICLTINSFMYGAYTKRINKSCKGSILPESGTTEDRSYINYCRTHNLRICLYIEYIACGPASLYIKTLYFFLTVLALSAAATVAKIKIRYDAKTPQFAIFGTRVICVFYSIWTIYIYSTT